MMKERQDESTLKIQLLRFDRPTPLSIRYYFMEMSTLQATTLLPYAKTIVSVHLHAYADGHTFLSESHLNTFTRLRDFNSFFQEHPEYDIHSCDLVLENGIKIGSHDDGEVSIEFRKDDAEMEACIDRIFEKHHLNNSLIKLLRSKPGYYIAIDQNSNVTGDFADFDDYLTNR